MNMRESTLAVLWIRMWLRYLNVLIGFVRVAFMNYDRKQKCGGDQMERFMGARMSLNVTSLCSKVLPSLKEKTSCNGCGC